MMAGYRALAAGMVGGVMIFGAILAIQQRASAASDDAWDDFRAAVTDSCLGAAQGPDGLFAPGATAAVDPFGSKSYGLALVEGAARGAEGTAIRAICVYDKRWETVELGGELPPR